MIEVVILVVVGKIFCELGFVIFMCVFRVSVEEVESIIGLKDFEFEVDLIEFVKVEVLMNFKLMFGVGVFLIK